VFASVTAGAAVGVGDGGGVGVGVRRGVGLGLGDGVGVGVGVAVGVGEGDGNGTGVWTGGGVRCVRAACRTDGPAPGWGRENSMAPSAQMPSSQTRAATPICTSGREPPPPPPSGGRAGTLVRGRA
jgi:hypothetical protein